MPVPPVPVDAPGAHGDGGAAAEGRVARVTLGWQKGGPGSRGPGRGGGGGRTVWKRTETASGELDGACGHHGSEPFLFNPLPAASQPQPSQEKDPGEETEASTDTRTLALESAMTGADILQASSQHQEQAGGTAPHLREAASARTSSSAAEEIGPRTRLGDGARARPTSFHYGWRPRLPGGAARQSLGRRAPVLPLPLPTGSPGPRTPEPPYRP
ncbi:uncharacterized protein LOC116572282 [Mustela erminea]|uniref:uncharacterized protein LOC116572282 n=1 Tax=Mustela erminea TaxID=36723 RepID=UPI0013866046|nr:uncharacterized protein LOC116572282 [Mustela erminea]